MSPARSVFATLTLPLLQASVLAARGETPRQTLEELAARDETRRPCNWGTLTRFICVSEVKRILTTERATRRASECRLANPYNSRYTRLITRNSRDNIKHVGFNQSSAIKTILYYRIYNIADNRLKAI